MWLGGHHLSLAFLHLKIRIGSFSQDLYYASQNNKSCMRESECLGFFQVLVK